MSTIINKQILLQKQVEGIKTSQGELQYHTWTLNIFSAGSLKGLQETTNQTSVFPLNFLPPSPKHP